MAQLYDIISKPFGLLMQGLYSLTGNYMIAIFLFSLICEVILIPMAIKQQKNQIKQASLAPRTYAIRKKYAGRNDQATQQKMQNEIMDMYQEEHFNPASGCGTLLIQFPIIILLYNVIRKPLTFISGVASQDLVSLAQRFGQENVTSANTVDEIALIGKIRDQVSSLASQFPSLAGKVIPETKVGPFDLSLTPTISFQPFDWLMLIPILTFVVMIVSQKIMKRYTYQDPTVADQQNNISMKIMEWTMPLFSVYIEFRFAAAIGIYWIFRNILQTVERIVIAKLYPLPKFSEEDYKEAERQANLSNKQKKREEREADPNRKPVRSLHHIDDEEYLARHPEQVTGGSENAETAEKTGKDAPAPLKDDYGKKK